MVQGGQINIANSRFSIPGIYGVQMMPDTALTPQVGTGVEVSGIARNPQARRYPPWRTAYLLNAGSCRSVQHG